VAKELCRRYPSAILFDPEQIGFMLRRTIPKPQRPPDFQDIPLWRELTVKTAVRLLETFDRPLIVPMTLVKREPFEEILGGLREAGVAVHHFTLTASSRTLRIRLLKRWDSLPSKLWTLRQVTPCVASLSDPRFAVHIPTDRRRVKEIADEIRSRLPANVL
jgi:hypothetical protein